MDKFFNGMKFTFEMSMIGELSFFLGLQVKQTTKGLFMSQFKYARIFFNIRYVAGTCDLGVWYTRDTNMYLTRFSDSDWAGCEDDRKSTSGGCFYVGNNLVSWYSRKQNCVSLSTAESEYVAAASACSQLIWLQHMLDDYGLECKELKLLCDNMSAINISKNHVQHSRTKQINIRHHFLRDMVEKGILKIEHVEIEKQLADIFTKALDNKRYSFLKNSLSLGSN